MNKMNIELDYLYSKIEKISRCVKEEKIKIASQCGYSTSNFQSLLNEKIIIENLLSTLLKDNNMCDCCGNNMAKVCHKCVSDIAQEAGNAAYNSK